MTITIIGKAKLRDHAIAIQHPEPNSYSFKPVYQINGVKGFIKSYGNNLHFFPLDDFHRNEYNIRSKEKHYPRRLKHEEVVALPKFYTNMLADLKEVD